MGTLQIDNPSQAPSKWPPKSHFRSLILPQCLNELPGELRYDVEYSAQSRQKARQNAAAASIMLIPSPFIPLLYNGVNSASKSLQFILFANT